MSVHRVWQSADMCEDSVDAYDPLAGAVQKRDAASEQSGRYD